MKKLITLYTAVLLTASVFAQAPQKMSYQAVIRNSSDALVTNQSVGMQISILQGSAGGTAVYVETQTPTTNANGLVSIEIGAGTVVSGNFSTIDWANGPYFIKTETDPTGGTNYTITGTSQLLSVPYALHAKTAESVTGTVTETDPIFGASVASGITGADTTKWNNKQDQLTAGTGINITNNVVSAKTYSVGDFAHGGIVFWVDETGQHGLVCAKEDQSTGIQWHNDYTATNAVRGGVGAGMYNTERIIANQGGGNYAAQSCANYQGGEYGDWYLPSKEELNLMYQNQTAINTTATANGGSGFAIAVYWSSTEHADDDSRAWVFYFGNGFTYYTKKYDTNYVRAVRAF